jgi:hypothetical protein
MYLLKNYILVAFLSVVTSLSRCPLILSIFIPLSIFILLSPFIPLSIIQFHPFIYLYLFFSLSPVIVFTIWQLGKNNLDTLGRC